ncbi:MAG: SUMF1/EgtB/PvdO family nonheme iron enzyme [Bacteroidetes bacterium]|nr:SUMF1/EgtB/PvdO family nonheme iron enzyme [Bacteroidota bacterium]
MKFEKINIVLTLFVLINYSTSAQNKKINAREKMAFIKGGIYTPLYGSKEEGSGIKVAPFFIDKYPVTNAQFLKFVEENPKWQRSKAETATFF